MKKIKGLILSFVIIFILSGCVKSNTVMDIGYDKSMSFSTKILVSEKLIKDENDLIRKNNFNKRSIEYTPISENGYKGLELTKKYKNIDDVSSTSESKEIIISDFFNDNFDDSVLFTVEEYFFKNKYHATYKYSNENDYLDEVTDTPSEDANEAKESETENDLTEQDINEMIKLANEMELKYTVNLPFKSTKNNATQELEDGKSLVWTLNTENGTNISYEFELYNITNICIFGGACLIVLLIIIFIISKISKKIRYKKVFSKSGVPILKEYDPEIKEELIKMNSNE